MSEPVQTLFSCFFKKTVNEEIKMNALGRVRVQLHSKRLDVDACIYFSHMLHTVIPNVADNYRMKNFADVTYKHICRSAIRASQFRETSQSGNFHIVFSRLSLIAHWAER